jgi:hypothetical protein
LRVVSGYDVYTIVRAGPAPKTTHPVQFSVGVVHGAAAWTAWDDTVPSVSATAVAKVMIRMP